jgi:hypothetical protein
MTEEQLREEFLAKRFIQAYKLTDEFAKQSCKIALNYIKKNGYSNDFEQYKRDRKEGYIL